MNAPDHFSNEVQIIAAKRFDDLDSEDEQLDEVAAFLKNLAHKASSSNMGWNAPNRTLEECRDAFEFEQDLDVLTATWTALRNNRALTKVARQSKEGEAPYGRELSERRQKNQEKRGNHE